MEYTTQISHRLKRVEGQIRGVQNMLSQGESCKDVVSQLSAARTAIDRTMAVIVAENLEQCVRESDSDESKDQVQEAIDLLVNSR